MGSCASKTAPAAQKPDSKQKLDSEESSDAVQEFEKANNPSLPSEKNKADIIGNASPTENVTDAEFNYKNDHTEKTHTLGLSAVDALILKAHGLTHIGYGTPPLKHENQDAVGLEMNGFAGIDDCYYFGVYDGHGNHGQIVAEFVAKNMPLIIAQELKKLDLLDVQNVSNVLNQSFLECEKQIEECSEIGFRGKMSGTTASVAICFGHELIVASVGDSRLILMDNSACVERLSVDHRPENQEEQDRILQAGGCVRPTAHFSGESESDIIVSDEQIGPLPPLRVWLKKEKLKPNGLLKPGPGLMLTRSLGDRISKVAGCTAEPTILHKTLIPGLHSFVVSGSDGVWDVLSDEQVARIVRSNTFDLEQCCDKILQDALEGWGRIGRADNISVIVTSIK